jgi:hypothetical protein
MRAGAGPSTKRKTKEKADSSPTRGEESAFFPLQLFHNSDLTQPTRTGYNISISLALTISSACRKVAVSISR